MMTFLSSEIKDISECSKKIQKFINDELLGKERRSQMCITVSVVCAIFDGLIKSGMSKQEISDLIWSSLLIYEEK